MPARKLAPRRAAVPAAAARTAPETAGHDIRRAVLIARAAARRVYNATRQRFWIHWMRNALAHARWDTAADALRGKQDKLGTFMDASRDEALACMDFPREHRGQIAPTNPRERVNREIKRRADVIVIFPDDKAIVRPVGTLMLETNDDWTVARSFISLETLARVIDTPAVRLPAVAA